MVFRSDLLLVRKIEVKSAEDLKGFVNVEEVQDAVLQHLAKSIVFLDTKEIAENLKKQFLAIAEVSVEKHLPDKLVVQIEEREPVAVLVIEEKYLVDKDGFVFAKWPRGVNLPELVLESEKGIKGLKIGEKIQGQLIVAALDIIDGVSEIEDLKPTAIKITGKNEIHVETDKTFLVLFTSQKKISEQILALKQIHENAKRQGKPLKKVDLRFKLPVVLY